jgi:NAD(P)-dependent dehydrogenase (short-subunit alcohol dehydrogenase family)
VHIARRVVGKVGPGGALLFIGGTGGRRPAAGALIAAFTAAMPALTKALELAPVRVNLIAPGFVDTPLSATLLGDQLACVASRSARRCRSGAWSVRPTSPRSPSTS